MSRIADALEKPVGTVKTWLHRARLELLQRLRQRGMVAAGDPGPSGPRGGTATAPNAPRGKR